MNYIYDIYLNFNKTIFDFFDWNKNDKLTHLKKIPIIKLNNKQFNLIYYNKFKLENNILDNIKNKTELWKNKNKLKYCIMFCTNSSIICVKFNNEGISNEKSCLFIDEELEILDSIHNLKEKYIKFKIIENEKVIFKTRDQIRKELFIKKKLSNIKDEELKYIYFECFEKFNSKEKMIIDIKNINKNSIKYENLYNMLKLISSIKK